MGERAPVDALVGDGLSQIGVDFRMRDEGHLLLFGPLPDASGDHVFQIRLGLVCGLFVAHVLSLFL